MKQCHSKNQEMKRIIKSEISEKHDEHKDIEGSEETIERYQHANKYPAQNQNLQFWIVHAPRGPDCRPPSAR